MAELPRELQQVVHQAIAVLGQVIKKEIGARGFQRVERLRREMARLRVASREEEIEVLRQQLRKMEKLTPHEQADIARAFTLMLELMNTCENAFRSDRIHRRRSETLGDDRGPERVIYVLTAHPTEARSPESIAVFHAVLDLLTGVFSRVDARLSEAESEALRHQLAIAWQIPIVRERKPRVKDEAEHIYTTLLRPEIMSELLSAGRELAPVYVRSWVGGDKDGHAGVDERAFIACLNLSRAKILNLIHGRLREVQNDLRAPSRSQPLRYRWSRPVFARLKSRLRDLERLRAGDARRVQKLKHQASQLMALYHKTVGVLHPSLLEIRGLLHIFPGLVVPLEFRESSDVLMALHVQGREVSREDRAIERMLQKLAQIAESEDPRWYVRGFIVSMTSEFGHMQAAASLMRATLGDLKVSIVPLFEQASGLRRSHQVIKRMLAQADFRRAIERYWQGQIEIMLGYSDSAKESGVLRSRLLIADSMHRLDRLCRRAKVTPVFFQGSGGSIDRGGGVIRDQMAWWSTGALRNYKVTLQGEMVERSFANPDITRGQLERIMQSSALRRQAHRQKFRLDATLERFADRASDAYRGLISEGAFFELIEKATPYRFLDLLKLGSRPSQRMKGEVSLAGLRAIPWVLCWTQTRVLIPTWWGVGRAWSETSLTERRHLIRQERRNPLLASFVKDFELTLIKVELPIWRLYLEQSGLSEASRERVWNEFCREYENAWQFVRAFHGANDVVAWRPWLRESIELRSPMIHPLNLLQLIAMRNRDARLLRMSVVGIASGMMTTG